MFLTLSTEGLSRRATVDRERTLLLTDASDTYFETVNAVVHESYMRVCSWVGLFDSWDGWEVSLTGVAFIWAQGGSLEGML
jgi:hypothetical protein